MKAKSFMLLLTIALLIGTILTGVCSAQEPTNYLKVKGKVISAEHVDYQVFKYNESDDNWVQIIAKEGKKKYSLRLATDSKYQVFFKSNEGVIKVMHIEPGTSGMWIEYVDLDFKKKDSNQVCLYRTEDDEYYNINLLPSYASNYPNN